MKCQLKPVAHDDQLFRLEFDRIIPRFFPRRPGLARLQEFPDREWLLHWSSPQVKFRHANILARTNQGKVPFELSDPIPTYVRTLEGLSRIEGLIEVADLDRYTLGLQVGSFFNAGRIAKQVASILQHNFYNDEILEFGNGFDNPATPCSNPVLDSSTAQTRS